MSERNTKIASSRFGDLRFGNHERKPNSEVVVYQLPPDEIRERYGSGPADILTREKFEELTSKRLSWKQMAEELKLPYQAVTHLASKYKNMDPSFSVNKLKDEQEDKKMSNKTVIREKEVLNKTQSILSRTKENYLLLKGQGLSDKEIADRFGMNKTNLPQYKKRWGVNEMVRTKNSNNDHVSDVPDEKIGIVVVSNDMNDLRDKVEQLEKENQLLRQQLQQQRDNHENILKQGLEAVEKLNKASNELAGWEVYAEAMQKELETSKSIIDELFSKNEKLQIRVVELEQIQIQASQSNLEEENFLLRKTLKKVL